MIELTEDEQLYQENSIWLDRDLTSKTKTHIYHAIGKSIITYAAETV